MHRDVKERIAHVIASNLDNPDVTINDDTRLEDLGIQSVKFIKIMVEIEAEFGIDIGYEELFIENENFSNLASITLFVQKKMQAVSESIS
ncbi:acyl carrier protein [Paenibacillus larvae]|uniref:Phosphopantetheine-binding protein n=4 Tax=Paenibacillus larvae TaxID=1464 RepID=V9W7E5_9BACL|nr:acyl carrier protein [Paenibacillus larvae]AHD05625.1 phosphopantetheine-binding protein [Paenibacillus larvae subsp. larvae DSM 25430]AQR76906.1 hypothetical protein BXP28_05545 [Paenibacillus larvae subsp. larvae]ARF70178.1 hypothetical protein B7C51_23545 [Paenibacillus larvae subsp. pulvifaciens]AVF22176.1 phosphopantetheine-binding protein [Paenibacillus larvae subsp. larvae]AVG12174.1 phosphopantetheine-binding protein [Paenibacillus larvae subsp. larvae DSM 25430]